MNILYLDESGVEDLNVPPPHFVLLGFMIPANSWKTIDGKIAEVKAKFVLTGEEIHTAPMARRYSEQESITDFESLDQGKRREEVQKEIKRRSGVYGVRGDRRKISAYRRETRYMEPFIHLTRRQRLQCLEEVANIVGAVREARIFAEAIRKSDFKPGRSTPYEMAFEKVLTRYQAYLGKKREGGIVVQDNNTKVAPRLHKICRGFHESGTIFRHIPNICETPLFVDSSLTEMIQVADLCAFGLRRFLDKGESHLWDIVEPRVDSNAAGLKVGIRHYTGKSPCSCRICTAHGRNLP